MKKPLFSLVALVGALTVSQVASAQTVTPGINARHGNERARIGQGVATGELTRTEAARLRAREAAIQQDKKAARADGVVTRDERQDIRAIYRQKHDNQTRPRVNR
ncbi:hypothetical protein [Hymenobacter antarcticus]|uniref:Uncharacterized protein n=1 Tax=Hymenobacter antarcticus TaxID=486270 RepID=A0ABP7R6U9_9BACT